VEFENVSRLAQEIGEQYGSFNDLECQELKSTLMTMEGPSRKAGRVRLADFYNKSLYSHWKFTEKAEYLRDLGALDETNASELLVILPNYITSRPQCLEATTLYAVCCRNECDDLMGHLEREIARPTASVERVAELVAAMPSGTVAAPRTLSPILLRRLQESSSAQDGKVHLHGRLFAQWMHHAFPRECPYPHEAGMTNPQTADEWMKQSGHTSERASDEEMRKIVEDACPADDLLHGGSDADQSQGVEHELPWTHAEELLVAAPLQAPWRPLCVLAWLTAALWAAFVLWHIVSGKCSVSRETTTRIAISVMCLVSFGFLAVELLDRAAFGVPLVFGLGMLATKARFVRFPQVSLQKADKSLV